jgi:predicted site-specific integrase-resolvase
MAVEVDPEQARLTRLADALCVEIHTVLNWIKKGRMPYNRARALNQRFGDDLAKIEVLTGAATK